MDGEIYGVFMAPYDIVISDKLRGAALLLEWDSSAESHSNQHSFAFRVPLAGRRREIITELLERVKIGELLRRKKILVTT